MTVVLKWMSYKEKEACNLLTSPTAFNSWKVFSLEHDGKLFCLSHNQGQYPLDLASFIMTQSPKSHALIASRHPFSASP